VTDDDGVIIARPFPKFFNYSQLNSVGLTVPDEPFEVYDKRDGSLIITFAYNNEWVCASRGSFISDYAIKASELIQNYPMSMLYTQQTYCFELVWREHVIVIMPEKDDLIMLGTFVTEDGREMDIQIPYYQDNFNVVKKYEGITDYTTLTTTIDGKNKEGFIIRFESGFRCKIKYDEYIRLHKIMTGVSTIDIWESLRDGVDIIQFCENVPDEFDEWVKEVAYSLIERYGLIWECSVSLFNSLYDHFNGDLSNKKLVAEWIKTGPSDYTGILFNMVNEKDFDSIIWKMIRPEHKTPNY
jgi:RNA ligase